ncbi:MAG: hypothetical protein AAB472_02610 [Patescibacteria group bacterium]
METAPNWNQIPFPVQAEIMIQLSDLSLSSGFFRRLTKRLREIIDSSEQWRDSPEHGGDWYALPPDVRGYSAQYKLMIPFRDIKPSQLRAFCSYVNRLAQRLAEDNDASIDAVYAKVGFQVCSTLFESGK